MMKYEDPLRIEHGDLAHFCQHIFAKHAIQPIYWNRMYTAFENGYTSDRINALINDLPIYGDVYPEAILHTAHQLNAHLYFNDLNMDGIHFVAKVIQLALNGTYDRLKNKTIH